MGWFWPVGNAIQHQKDLWTCFPPVSLEVGWRMKDAFFRNNWGDVVYILRLSWVKCLNLPMVGWYSDRHIQHWRPIRKRSCKWFWWKRCFQFQLELIWKKSPSSSGGGETLKKLDVASWTMIESISGLSNWCPSFAFLLGDAWELYLRHSCDKALHEPVPPRAWSIATFIFQLPCHLTSNKLEK